MAKRKTALVCGGGGFIGNYLVNQLKKEGYFVKVADLQKPLFGKSLADSFVIADLRDPKKCEKVFDQTFDEVYQLAAEVGGAGYTFTGDYDAEIMHNSALINLNLVDLCRRMAKKVFFSSSACVYPKRNQNSASNPNCCESSAYPADPDSEYGWEKLFSERLYLAYAKNFKLNIRVARFHNVYGPEGIWQGGREKAPAAICRKVAMAKDHGSIEIWGDGKQTRSFLYINDCINGIRKLMKSGYNQPINIGSEEMVSINQLAEKVISLSDKDLKIKHVPGTQGVRGRNSDNRLAEKILKWEPKISLDEGIKKTYLWVREQTQI